MDVCPPRNFLMFLFRLTSFILLGIVRVVQLEECDNTTFSVHRVSGNNQGDIFTHLSMPCPFHQSCSGCEDYRATQTSSADNQCKCQCNTDYQTFLFDKCHKDFSSEYVESMEDCQQKVFLDSTPQNGQILMSQEMQMLELPRRQGGFLTPHRQLLNSSKEPIYLNCNIESTGEYFYQYTQSDDNQNWMPLSTLRRSNTPFFSIGKRQNSRRNFIKFNGSPTQELRSCFSGLIIGLIIDCGDELEGCVSFKLEGTLSYDHSTGIAQCFQGDTTISSGSTPNGMMERQGSSTPAIVGGVCGAAVIFIIAGVAVFMLWRRKFRHNTEKGNNRGVTMSSLQNGHSQPTEGTVDNVIYAGDNAGIVDNLIYEGGMGADGVFSNPGYADKTPQFKPRMDVPGAFVQPNPGATNKTPQPQRNVIIDEPQYAQIVDDQYADPQKVRDKKNKKKAAKDKNYADLHGPQPGANNSNSNHVYQGLNKGADYQSLRGPREHHEVRPSQVPKTPQDGHDYASLAPGGSKPSAGRLSKEGPDYTVLEGPDSPGEETAAGPDYTTLDGPDSPGDEITSGPDYTVLDGPDSPGD